MNKNTEMNQNSKLQKNNDNNKQMTHTIEEWDGVDFATIEKTCTNRTIV